MSANQGQGAAQGNKDCGGCGYDPQNPRHQESYWEGASDPREMDDKNMRFNSQYYKMIDRQIAEDHNTRCLGNQGQGGQKK